jgi:DNA-binding MarR family transcriptional regulator
MYAVKRLELTIRARLDEMLRDSGVTTLQYTALTVLERGEGISAAQLARDSFVSPQAMADMLRALERHQLIERAPNPRSRRELLVFLTPGGRAFLDRFAGPAEALEQAMVADLSAAEVAAFARALSATRASLRPAVPLIG